MLVKMKRGMLFNASGGVDTPPMTVVTPRPISREIYTVRPKTAIPTR